MTFASLRCSFQSVDAAAPGSVGSHAKAAIRALANARSPYDASHHAWRRRFRDRPRASIQGTSSPSRIRFSQKIRFSTKSEIT
jgi:hypothetical protein